MAKTVADLLTDTLAETGVERIYGVSGDSLNGMTDSILRQGRIPVSRQELSMPPTITLEQMKASACSR